MSLDLSPSFAVTPGTYLPPGTSINPLRSTGLDESETSVAMRSRQEIPSVWLDNGNAKDRAVVTTSGEEPASAVPLNTFRVDVVAPPNTLEANDEPRNILDNTVQAELAEAAQPLPSAIPGPIAEKKAAPPSTDDFSKQLARAADDAHPSKPPAFLPGPGPAEGPGVEIPTLGANPAPIIADVSSSTPAFTLPPETDLSAELYQEAEQIAQDAKSVDDLSRVIQLCRQTGDATVAIDLLEAAQRLAAWAYNRRGELHLAADRLTDAIDDFKAAVELDPECWLAYHNRAVTYAERGQNEAALKDFQRVIELYPALGIAYRNRAELLASIGRTADAIPDYNRALEQFPDDLELLLSRGHAFHRLGKYRQALADFDSVVELDASLAEAFTFRGNVYAELSDFERAQQDFEKSIELLPNQCEAYRSLAWMMAACPDSEFRNPDRAVETAKLSQKYSKPGDFLVLDTLAAAYASSEQFDRAARFQEQAIAMAPKEIDTEEMEARLALYEERQPFHHDATSEVRPASLEEPWPVIIDDQP
jgi:tetratricopeptide (TPR) repeat protein